MTVLLRGLAIALWGGIGLSNLSVAAQNPVDSSGCPAPVLSRLQRYRLQPGDTLATVAQKYDLIPATLLGFNPSLRNGSLVPGTEIVVPPYNGIQVTVPSGKTWRDVAIAYRVRPDVLFEANGCQASPKVVFVPGVNWSPNASQASLNSTSQVKFPRYPLAAIAPTGLVYGWQLQPKIGDVAFHAGVDLLAPVGTPVFAVAPGTVAFAGTQRAYGQLVVINHAGGRQTRYAQLSQIQVKVGQVISAGTPIGKVGQSGAPSALEPHLHFEVRTASKLGWVAEDPRLFLASPAAQSPTPRPTAQQP